MTYALKQTPEDFIVTEKTVIEKKATGDYTYFYLEKKNYDTIKAVATVAHALQIPAKRIGYAGNKDKKAITTQLCSVRGVSEKALEGLQLKDIKIIVYGRGDEPISLGDLEGNFFKITIRDITELPSVKDEFINYFGEQRFSKNNAVIGKLLVEKQFEQAVGLMEHKEVKEYILQYPTDFIGALNRLPKKLLSLYVHSYQSLLWNTMAKECKQLPATLPLIGFGTEENGLVEQVLEKEGIGLRDFIFPQIKPLSSAGGERATLVHVKDLQMGKLEPDEMNNGKKKVVISFFLPKGAYATEYIKSICS